MRQPPGTRRDLQAGTAASPVGAAQQPLVARNTVSQIMTSGSVQPARQYAVIPPVQNIAQPYQQGNQAVLFNIGASSAAVRPTATQITPLTATQITRSTATAQPTVITSGRTY